MRIYTVSSAQHAKKLDHSVQQMTTHLTLLLEISILLLSPTFESLSFMVWLNLWKQKH